VLPESPRESGASIIHLGTSNRLCDGKPLGIFVTWGCKGWD